MEKGSGKILHLTLKKKWFDMIASGEKKEEYREIKRYWADRLTYHEHHERITCVDSLEDEIYRDHSRGLMATGVFKQLFDVVEFKNGYSANAPIIRLKFESVRYGYGHEDWGAEPGKKYFVIKLGERIE
jgi:hypothetical protein